MVLSMSSMLRKSQKNLRGINMGKAKKIKKIIDKISNEDLKRKIRILKWQKRVYQWFNKRIL